MVLTSSCSRWAVGLTLLASLVTFATSIHPQCERLRNKPGSIIYPSPDAPGAINVTFAQLFSFCSQLATLGEDQIWWHYGSYNECFQYISTGKISTSFMRQLIDPRSSIQSPDSPNVAGLGFYVAKDPKSSSKYGLCSSYVFVPADTLVLDRSILYRVFEDRILPNTQAKVWLGNLVPFIDIYMENVNAGSNITWAVIHSADPLDNVEVGPKDGNNDPQTYKSLSLLESDDVTSSLQLDVFTTFSRDAISSLPLKNKDALIASSNLLQLVTISLILRDPLRVVLDNAVNVPWTVPAQDSLLNFWTKLISNPESIADTLSYVDQQGIRHFGSQSESKDAWSTRFADRIWPQYSSFIRAAPYRTFCLQPIILHSRERLYRSLQPNRHLIVSATHAGDVYTINITRPCSPQTSRGLRMQVIELASSLYGAIVSPNSVVEMVSALCAMQPSTDQECLAAKLLGNAVSSKLMFWNRVPMTEMMWAFPQETILNLVMAGSSHPALPRMESAAVQYVVQQWMYHNRNVTRVQEFGALPEFHKILELFQVVGGLNPNINVPPVWRYRLDSNDFPTILDDIFSSHDWDRILDEQ